MALTIAGLDSSRSKLVESANKLSDQDRVMERQKASGDEVVLARPKRKKPIPTRTA